MKYKITIFAALLFLIFLSDDVKAQTQCKTYTCYLCLWGGEFKVEIPNVFTPNRDEVNDYWVPKIYNQTCLSDYNVKVFNRWGNLMFETSVYSVAWNGNEVVAGTPCPEGTYYYLMTYSDVSTKETKHIKGFLQLLR